MSSFEQYLQRHKQRTSTIRNHLQNVGRFKKQSPDYQHADYNDLLKFIEDNRKRGVSKSTINMHLNSVSKYYDYLIETGVRTDNPAKALRLKDGGKSVLQHLLTPTELEVLYLHYRNTPEWHFKGARSKQVHERNIVILGLLVYQGIQTTVLKKMEQVHLNLSQGTVYLPAAGRSNSRILKLDVKQIVPMSNYLRSLKAGEALFPMHLVGVMEWLTKRLKKLNEKVISTGHLRSSVIMQWLRQYNIRQVQYMAGHKHISSTERYKQEDLQDLQAALKSYHPMR